MNSKIALIREVNFEAANQPEIQEEDSAYVLHSQNLNH